MNVRQYIDNRYIMLYIPTDSSIVDILSGSFLKGGEVFESFIRINVFSFIIFVS